MINTKTISYILMVFFFTSCSNKSKFSIEKQSDFIVAEANYHEWISGVRGGGSGLSVFIVVDNFEAIKETIQLKGIYFMKKYAELKFHSPNKYQAFINTNKNSKDEYFEGDDVKAIVNEKKDETFPFPFNLNENEAVISYTINNKLKYSKIILSKKENMGIPR